MAVELSTVARVRSLITSKGGQISAGADDQLLALTRAYSAIFERYLDRWTETTERIETVNVEPGQMLLRLRGYPVDAIDGIWNDASREYGDASLIDPAHYFCDSERGMVFFDNELASGAGALRFSYTGGMAEAGTDPTANFVEAFPDIAVALDLQVAHAWQRSNAPGSAGLSLGGGTASYTGQLDLLDHVRAILAKHRRVGL